MMRVRLYYSTISAEEVLIFTIVLGELYAGFRFGTRYDLSKKALEKFLTLPDVTI